MTCETQCQSYHTDDCAVWRKDKAPFELLNPTTCSHFSPNGKIPTPVPEARQPKQLGTTWKPPDRTHYFCMDCKNFRTPACLHPDRKILDDPCGKRGSLQQREIPRGNKRYPYWYCAHYDSSKASKLRWCYIGKNLPTQEAEEK